MKLNEELKRRLLLGIEKHGHNRRGRISVYQRVLAESFISGLKNVDGERVPVLLPLKTCQPSGNSEAYGANIGLTARRLTGR